MYLKKEAQKRWKQLQVQEVDHSQQITAIDPENDFITIIAGDDVPEILNSTLDRYRKQNQAKREVAAIKKRLGMAL